jgi:hypothetical protein
VESLTGPVIDRRAEREAFEQRWAALFAAAADAHLDLSMAFGSPGCRRAV